MRYIIETETPSLIEDFVEGRTDVKIIDSYEPIERLTARVEKISRAFHDFKESRGSWEILVRYLRGRGIPWVEIDRVLKGVEAFLKEVED